MNELVTTEWLAEHLSDVKVVDASWYMPNDKRDPRAEFEQAHIPGAAFFDIDDIRDKATDLPHMLPSAAEFSVAVAQLGIGSGDTVIVYDGAGIFSAPRVWWMFKTMGHDKVAVLDGGLPKWQRENLATESGRMTHGAAAFTVTLKPELIRDVHAVKNAVADKSAALVDARSPGRFTAAEAEPRAGIRGGHMPGAANVHFRSLLTPEGTFKSDAELRAAFEQAGMNLSHPIVTTCGTGVTAAILLLALNRIGALDVALYDGSWTEWGGRSDTPVETG